MAADCAKFTLGSDLGGSLRIPATFCGVNVFMPTGRRQSAHGNSAYFMHENINMNPLNTIIGPFAKNVEDLARIMKVYFSEKMLSLEKHLPQLPFDTKMYDQTLNARRLKIGIIKDMESSIGMCSSAKRALIEAENHLKSLGHEVIEVEIPNIEAHIDNHLALFMSQTINLVNDNWSERCDDLNTLSPLLVLYKSNKYFARAVSKLLKLIGQERLGNIIKICEEVDNGKYSLS